MDACLIDMGGARDVDVDRALLDRLRDETTFWWLDLHRPGDEAIVLLGEVFGFHPLAVEDARSFGQRPKIEEFDDFVFLVVYLFAAVTKLGWRKTLAFTLIAWAVAYVAEFGSTRTGIPFGLYHYVDTTRDRELWLANVPFFDSLSFSFLCYLGWALALFLYAPLLRVRGDFQVVDTREIRTSTRVLLTGAFLTMLLDLVIDPLTVRGDRWFLGRIYYYPEGGIHFGVPLSNYAGWFLVALVTVAAFQALERRVAWSPAGVAIRSKRGSRQR